MLDETEASWTESNLISGQFLFALTIPASLGRILWSRLAMLVPLLGMIFLGCL